MAAAAAAVLQTSGADERGYELGFVGKCEGEEDQAWLRSPAFPSKVGGRPAWLAYAGLPAGPALNCAGCNERLIFLCQINTDGLFPGDANYHRSLFVFTCTSADCMGAGRAGGFRVYRGQLPQDNPWYHPEPPVQRAEEGEEEEDEEQPEAPTFKAQPDVGLCSVCGCGAEKRCARCKKAWYCTVNHQKWHWGPGGHKAACTAEASDAASAPAHLAWPHGLPELELLLEEEVLEDDQTEEERQADFDETASRLKVDTTPEDLTELEQEINKDKFVVTFRERTRPEPTQVSRYKKGGWPLWIGSRVPDDRDIPPCPNCGDERQYECQIMPQLIYQLQKYGAPKDMSLDFGVLAIYSCPSSCEVEGQPYVAEVVWHNKVDA